MSRNYITEEEIANFLVESDEEGYILDIIVYTGSESDIQLDEKYGISGFIHPVPRTESRGRHTRRKCHVCSHTANRPQKRQHTKYMCTKCNVALCIYPCFEEYHTKKLY